MTLEEAMDLVRNEAETSALGEGNEEVMEAVEDPERGTFLD